MIAGRGVVPCECRTEKIVAAKIAALPAHFREATFANYRARDDKQLAAFTAIASNHLGSYFLWGGYGRGKTHLATAQYRKLVELGEAAMFFTMADLLAELRMAEIRLFEEYVCIVRDRAKYATRFHLFIDDIDKFKITEFKFEVLFDLVNTLYSRKLGLTITSNLSLTELMRVLDTSIVRRIDDMCQAVEV